MLFQIRSTWWIAAIAGIILGTSIWTSLRAREESAGPKIRVVEKTDKHPFEFEVVGLPAGLLSGLSGRDSTDDAFRQLFSVTVAGKPGDASIPPVAGNYRVDGARLVFVPRFPPQPGLAYRAVLQGDPGTEPVVSRLEQKILIPKPQVDPNRVATHVHKVYPSGNTLPENHLRFYLHFSHPMSIGAAYDNLQLLDAQGQILPGSFLELGEELWDPARQRFTLLFDPGRIKQGLKPREDLGPVLEAGKKYTLVVKREWRDAEGQLLKADFRKSFSVGDPIEKPLEVADWKVQAPHAGTRDPFSVEFPRPLDHALLARLLRIVDAAGDTVRGETIVGPAERRWTFTPTAAWPAGRFRLVVDTVLEDSAGNRIGRAFEVDEQETVTREIVPEYVDVPFEVQ